MNDLHFLWAMWWVVMAALVGLFVHWNLTDKGGE